MTLTPTTRASLLVRLRDAGDHRAWSEFAALYEPLTYGLLRRHGLQDADAREVLQELLLVVSRSIDRWRPERERGSFRGWLRRVVRNLVINWLKHRQRHVAAPGGAELQAMLDQLPAPEVPEAVEFDHQLRQVFFQRAAEKVRGEFRPAVWQAFWETAILGASAAEAAAAVGMSAGAVRVAKCRVLARLQTCVARWEQST